MVELALAMVFLVLSHVVPSAPRVRDRLIAVLGRSGFFAAYGTLSLILLIWAIAALQAADPGAWLYVPPAQGRAVAVLVMPLAVVLVCGRLMQRPDDVPRGIYRISSAPGSFGLLLWSVLHLLNLGSVRHVLLFGGMALIALVGTVKNARAAPPARRHVGALPLLAVLRGRERMRPGELAAPLLVGLPVYALLLGLHPVLLGPDPLAGLW